MPKQTKIREEIREELKLLLFSSIGIVRKGKIDRVLERHLFVDNEAIWQFINSTLDTQLNNIIEELEGWEEWQCENPKCKAVYTEYVNGCPKCETGEVGGSHSVYGKPMTLSTAIKIIKKYK